MATPSGMSSAATGGATRPTSAVTASSAGRMRSMPALIPAFLISIRTSFPCSGSTRVTTVPAAPARAVRPDRCR